jgi:hypothetical protein
MKRVTNGTSATSEATAFFKETNDRYFKDGRVAYSLLQTEQRKAELKSIA